MARLAFLLFCLFLFGCETKTTVQDIDEVQNDKDLHFDNERRIKTH